MLGSHRNHIGIVQIPGDRSWRDNGQGFLLRLLQDEFGLFEASSWLGWFGGLHDLVWQDQGPRRSWENGFMMGKGVWDVVIKIKV